MPIDTHCALSVAQSRRAGVGSSWVSGTTSYQIYDVVFTNTGSEPLLYAEFSVVLDSGYPASWWGLTKVCCTQITSVISFNVSLPATGLNVGASISAGFILRYSSTSVLADPEYTNPIVPTEYYAWVVCSHA
jgi:hypothetical protein